MGITSSVLSAIPYTTYVGVGIGLTDVAGGFNGWYNAWNSAEISYKTTGVAILPITSNRFSNNNMEEQIKRNNENCILLPVLQNL